MLLPAGTANADDTDVQLAALEAELADALKDLKKKNGSQNAEQKSARVADLTAKIAQLEKNRGTRQYLFDFRDGTLFSGTAQGTTLTPQERKEREELFGKLQRRIDVELQDASVRQAAEAISEASGVKISVDRNVSRDKRLSVTARSIPSASVLEHVARQAGLVIAPDGSNGVVLKSAPELNVGGRRTRVIEPFSPWTSEWGTAPLSGRLGYRFEQGPLTGLWQTGPPGSPASARTFADLSILRQPTGPVSMTGLGSDTFVVASPAPSGSEPGVILTVYRLQGNELRVVTTTFHRFGKAPSEVSGPRTSTEPASPKP